MINLVYVVGFSVDGYSGRAQGSVAKANCFAESPRVAVFKFLSLNHDSQKKLTKTLAQCRIGFNLLFILMTKHIDVVIHRDVPFVMLLCVLFRRVCFVNEIHAVPWEEISSKSIFLRFLIWGYKFQYLANARKSDLIIFNHPKLQRYYIKKFSFLKPSKYFYNGGTFGSTLSDNDRVRGLSNPEIIFSYCGNINFWHGVEKIIPILERLTEVGLSFKFILCGGQQDAYTTSVRKQFLRLDYVEVYEVTSREVLMQYIGASDFCFLPVAQVRTSPGNPIKLFDYVGKGKRVITQKELEGYSDLLPECLGHIHIDFDDPEGAALEIGRQVSKSTAEVELGIFDHARTNQSWCAVTDGWLDFIVDNCLETN